MKCGYGKKERLEGYIPTPSIEWHPKYGKNKLFYKGEKKDGFRLGKFSCLNQKEQLAWYCPHCDCIVIDCKELQIDELIYKEPPSSGSFMLRLAAHVSNG